MYEHGDLSEIARHCLRQSSSIGSVFSAGEPAAQGAYKNTPESHHRQAMDCSVPTCALN